MSRTPANYIFSYFVFFVGISILSLGIVMITWADLGTTAISSLPYVACLGLRPSMGFFTVALNLSLVGLQFILLRKKFPRVQLLQLPAAFVFGLCIDFWMALVPSMSAETYLLKALFLAAGTVVLAVGIVVEVCANVVVLPGEGAVMALTLVLRRKFGSIKVAFDVSLVALGLLLSLILFHSIEGIREGTVFSAIFVGVIVKYLFALRDKLLAKRKEAKDSVNVD